MKLLDACLALALTLAVFASAVTVLVEILHRAAGQRVRDARGLLGAVFDSVLTDKLGDAKKDLPRLRANFIDTLGTDKVLDTLVRSHAKALKPFRDRIAAAPKVPVEDALHRLPRSAVFQECLLALDKDRLEEVLNEVAERYTQFERAVSEFFRIRAQSLSYLVGILLAVTMNIDAVRLFNHFVEDPDLARQTIAQLESTLKQQEASASAGVPQSAQAKTAPAQATATADDDVRAVLEKIRAQSASGLPIGWAYYPFCVPPDGDKQVDTLCLSRPSAQPTQAHKTPMAWLRVHGQYLFWALCTAMTGLLIGLGGQYWFDVASSLGRMRDQAKSGQVAKGNEPQPTAPDPKQKVKDLVEQHKGSAGAPPTPAPAGDSP